MAIFFKATEVMRTEVLMVFFGLRWLIAAVESSAFTFFMMA
jgi:hypothetical protein